MHNCNAVPLLERVQKSYQKKKKAIKHTTVTSINLVSFMIIKKINFCCLRAPKTDNQWLCLISSRKACYTSLLVSITLVYPILPQRSKNLWRRFRKECRGYRQMRVKKMWEVVSSKCLTGLFAFILSLYETTSALILHCFVPCSKVTLLTTPMLQTHTLILPHSKLSP